MSRPRIRISDLILIIAFVFALTVSSASQTINTEIDALTVLMKGNERFVAGKPRPKDYLSERSMLTQSQHPYAIVLACADSRVPPELIFDESLGRIFVVRTAGHVVDPVALGSIEYAVEHLHVGLLLVLGHESCGAVKATISGGEASPNIKALMKSIKPAIDKVWSRAIAERERLSESVKENVRYQMQRAIFESEVLSEHVYEKRLTVVGGVYGLRTGRVEMVAPELAVERTGSKRGDRKSESRHRPKTEIHPDDEDIEGQSLSVSRSDFEKNIRWAYERRLDVMIKQTTLMRDEHDRCATYDCQHIAPGEVVRLENPFVLNVMGRPHLKVRYKGKTCFILADAIMLESISI